MSRCHPFPPPGYVLSVTQYKWLIDSIKEAKEEVKKLKRKEKKRKERENEAGRSRKHRHKRQRKDVEFLVKSCQTVELERRTSSQSSCDSTLHSNERPKQIQSQPLDETGIRTGLPDKGQKDPEAEVMKINKDQKQCFSSERDITTKLSKEKKSVPSKDNRKVSKDTMPSSSSWTHQEQQKPSSCPPFMAEKYMNLIENWTPDRAESKLTDSEDQEWWSFIKVGAKRQQVSNEKTNQGSSSMVWPTARFLPEVGLCALPYTVPF